MVGSVHTVQTIELLRQLRRDGFAGAIYFDTFPDVATLDPVAECAANVDTIEAMFDVLDRLPEAELDAALQAARRRSPPIGSSRRPSSAGRLSRPAATADDAERPRVCVVGSLHFDIMVRAPYLPRTGETLIGDAWWWKQGGKGGNQAVAAARHGAAVRDDRLPR